MLKAIALSAAVMLVAACDTRTAPSAPVAPALSDADAQIQAEAIQTMKATGVIPHAEWLDGDFIIAARENGDTWEPVADRACSWIREQGYTPKFSVIVLEQEALRNRRLKQLARARCA